jgi:hypothetical protein
VPHCCQKTNKRKRKFCQIVNPNFLSFCIDCLSYFHPCHHQCPNNNYNYNTK